MEEYFRKAVIDLAKAEIGLISATWEPAWINSGYEWYVQFNFNGVGYHARTGKNFVQQVKKTADKISF